MNTVTIYSGQLYILNGMYKCDNVSGRALRGWESWVGLQGDVGDVTNQWFVKMRVADPSDNVRASACIVCVVVCAMHGL